MTETDKLDLVEQRSGDEAAVAARAEARRSAAVHVVNAIFRLIRVLRIHNETNQAVASLVDGTVSAVAEFCERTGADNVSVLFTEDTVFVNGQMLRGTRETYATALQLGAYFERCGISEVTLARAVTRDDVAAFARGVSAAMRDASAAARLVETPLGAVRLRKLRARATAGEKLTEIGSQAERIVRTYATSVVVMRAFYDDLRRGRWHLPNRIKRIAQRLVSHAEEDAPLLVSLTAARPPDDVGAAAVNTAVTAILVARQLTTDRVTLAGLAMAALLHEAPRVRLATGDAMLGTLERTLNDEQLDALPASAVVALTLLGRIHGPSIARTVLSFEAHWSDRARRIGPVYRGRRRAAVLANVLSTARAFNELMTTAPGTAPLSIEEAVHALSERAADETERTFVRLLVGALGIFPVGSTVELSTGEIAIVTGSPSLPAHAARPPVRITYGIGGQLLPVPLDVDLAAPPARGAPPRCIRRALHSDEHQLKAMRSYVAAVTSGKRPAGPPPAAATPPPPSAAPASVERAAPLAAVAAPGAATAVTHAPSRAPAPAPTAVARPAPSAAPPAGDPTVRLDLAPLADAHDAATRAVAWIELPLPSEATQLELASDAEPTVRRDWAPEPPPAARAPGGAAAATRQVSWEDYRQQLAEPAASAPATSRPTSRPSAARPTGGAPAATRQVSWEDYQHHVEPRPTQPPPAARTTAPPPRRSLPPPSGRTAPPAAPTRQVAWTSYRLTEGETAPEVTTVRPMARATAAPPPGVEPQAQRGSALDDLLRDYLGNEAGPPVAEQRAASEHEPPEAPRDEQAEPAAQPIARVPVAPRTRAMRWTATNAFLRDLSIAGEEGLGDEEPPEKDDG